MTVLEGEGGGCTSLPGQTNTALAWLVGAAGLAFFLGRRRRA
jgi:MYXO-CTERM domain-containing protein